MYFNLFPTVSIWIKIYRYILYSQELISSSHWKICPSRSLNFDQHLVSRKLATQDLPATISLLKASLAINPEKRFSAFDLFGKNGMGREMCLRGWSLGDRTA